MSLVVTRGKSESEQRRVLRLAEQGKLRSLYAGIFTDDLDSPLETVIKREIHSLCAILAPGSIISYRSAIDISSSQIIYLTGTYRRTIQIGSVQLRMDKGPEPLPQDVSFPNDYGPIYTSSLPRALLEVLTRGRTTNGEKRTLDAQEIEVLLRKQLNVAGERDFDELRNQAKVCAAALGLEKSFAHLDKIMSSVLKTRALGKAPVLLKPASEARLQSFASVSQQPQLNFFSGGVPSVERTSLNKRGQPEFSYNRIWSSPVSGVSDDVSIASVIAEPTLQDLITCSKHYGIARVRKIYHTMQDNNELSALKQKSVGRMLGNIEIGFARAA